MRRLLAPFALLAIWPGLLPAQRLFLGGETFPLPSPANALLLEDFDEDGRLDIAAAHGHGGAVSVHMGVMSAPLGPQTAYPVGLSPVMVLAGNFDGDGWQDLFSVNSGSASISVLLNRGDGAFGEARHATVGLNPRAGGLADFDADGTLDAVTSDLVSVTHGRLTLLLGDGRGGMTAGAAIDVGDNAHSLSVDDFTGDGLPDVAVAHTRTLSLFASRGDGTFEPGLPTSLGDINPRALAAGDFDGDRRPDAATFNDQRNILFLRNAGGGRFAPRVVDNPGLDQTAAPLIGVIDFDGDGALDIHTGSASASFFRLGILRGDGVGGFRARDDIFLGIGLGSAAVRDLDGDGFSDVVVARSDAPDLALFRGTGAGSIGAPIEIALPAAPRDVIAFDFDRDGRKDLAALSSTAVHFARAGGTGFEAAVTAGIPGGAFQSMASGDFDGDGSSDLAITDLATRQVLIVAVDRDGAIQVRRGRATHDLPFRLVGGDFDGDGRLDLVVADQAHASVLLLRHPGSDEPAAEIELPVGAGQTAIEAADLDGDGALDVAAASRDGITLFFGDGSGAFPGSRKLERPRNAAALAAGDTAGDGEMDLVAASGEEVVILHGAGLAVTPRAETLAAGIDVRALALHHPRGGEDPRLVLSGRNAIIDIPVRRGGGFGPRESYPLGFLLRGLAVADFDGDGLTDCAAANFGSRSAVVLRGTRVREEPFLRRGDADQDGHAAMTDAIVVLDRLFRGGAPLACDDAADADDDGILAITDAIGLLAYLFQGGSPPPHPGPAGCGTDPTPDDLAPCSGPCT